MTLTYTQCARCHRPTPERDTQGWKTDLIPDETVCPDCLTPDERLPDEAWHDYMDEVQANARERGIDVFYSPRTDRWYGLHPSTADDQGGAAA